MTEMTNFVGLDFNDILSLNVEQPILFSTMLMPEQCTNGLRMKVMG